MTAAIRPLLRDAFLPSGDPLRDAVWICLVVCLASLLFSIALAQAAVVVAAACWCARIALRRPYRFRRSALAVPFAAFIAARCLAIPLSVRPDLSVVALRTEIFFYVLFFIALNEIDVADLRVLRVLVRTLFVSAALAALVGAARYALGATARAASTTAGYYTLGLYLAVVLAICLALGRRREFFPDRRIWYLGCFAMLAGLALTFNRLHWIAAAAAILVVGLRRERLFLGGAALAALAGYALSPALALRVGAIGHAASNLSGRDVLWRGFLMLAGERPLFGHGLRSFEVVFPLRAQLPDPGVGSWHNDYIQVYMDSGALGLAAFVATAATALVLGALAYRRSPAGSLRRDLAGALWLAAAVFAAAGGMLDTLLGLLYRVVIALLALLYLSTIPQRQEAPQEAPSP